MESVRYRTVTPREGIGIKELLIPFFAFVLLAGVLAGCGGSKPPSPPPDIAAAASDSSRASEIPPLVAAPPAEIEEDAASTPKAAELVTMTPEVETYHILVDDELTLVAIGYPELSGPVRVLPDGTITIPGVGPVYVLGATVAEATAKVNEMLGAIVRFPRATVSVTRYGDRRVFVMGEVVGPGDHAYHRGLTAVGAIAMAGGFNNLAKRSSVMVLRRTGQADAVAFRLDARDPLKGKHLEKDLPLLPYDIVYVPKTFIGSVNILFDQYFAQLTPPFSLYLIGWNAFHVDDKKIRLVTP
jgi:protein involved in polysaccharide export with SLBB domain